jgi:hypothetical protein
MAPRAVRERRETRVERATSTLNAPAGRRAESDSNGVAPARQRVKNGMYAAFALYFLLTTLQHRELLSHILHHVLCAVIAVRTVDEFSHEQGTARGDSLRMYALMQVAGYFYRKLSSPP